MDSTYTNVGKRLPEEEIFPPRKRFKISELPLNSAQRSTIDGLLHTIKKKGEYDALRKKVWSQFVESDANKAFNSTLNDLAEAEIDRDPSLLSRDRGKAATLMQGAVDRSDIYRSVEAALDALIEKNMSQVYEAGREIRRAEVGEDVTMEEEKRGSKTEEEYAKESAARREAREQEKERALEAAREKAREEARDHARQEAMQKFRQQEEERKRREAEMEKLKAEELTKKLELERLNAEEKKREEEALEKRKAIEREAHEREAQLYKLKRLEQQKENERRELYERREREMEERERDHHRNQETVRFKHEDTETVRLSDLTSRLQPSEFIKQPSSPPAPPPAPPPVPPPVDEKALEEAALQLLLREGREMAAKSTSKPEFERSESLDPLHRKHPLFPKAKFSESSPMKVVSPLKSPLRKPDHPPVPKLGYSTTAIREPPNPAYHSHDHSETQPRHSRNNSRSRSCSKTRCLSHRTDEPRDSEHEKVTYCKTKAYAQRESEAEAYKRREGRRRSDTKEHDLLPLQDRHYRDRHHHHLHSERPKQERGSRSRERRYDRPDRPGSPGMKSGRIVDYEQGRAERVHRFSVRSVVMDVDSYNPSKKGCIEREKKDEESDRRRGREERLRKERRREERDGREERDWSDDGREDKHRREERYNREGGREERYRRIGGRDDKYRREREGWRDEKPRVALIDRYVPGGGEPKRRGREGEEVDRYLR